MTQTFKASAFFGSAHNYSRVCAAACVTLVLTGGCLYADAADRAIGTQLGYQFVGQVLNVSAVQSLQYGYLSSVPGLDMISTSGPVSEGSALLTFYNDTTTQQVMNNGPIRVIERTGTSTIYFNAAGGGNFSNPDSFRSGTAIQTCNLRHQVILDTSSGYFTVKFEMFVTSARMFQINGMTHRLGSKGEVYGWTVAGKLTQQGPPSAQIAGFASGSRAELINLD